MIDGNFIYAIFQLFNWLTVGNTCHFAVLRSPAQIKGKMFGGFVSRVGARSFIHVSKREKKGEYLIKIKLIHTGPIKNPPVIFF